MTVDTAEWLVQPDDTAVMRADIEFLVDEWSEGDTALILPWEWSGETGTVHPVTGRNALMAGHPYAGATVEVIGWDADDWYRLFSCRWPNGEIPAFVDPRFRNGNTYHTQSSFWVPRLRKPEPFSPPASVAEAQAWLEREAALRNGMLGLP